MNPQSIIDRLIREIINLAGEDMQPYVRYSIEKIQSMAGSEGELIAKLDDFRESIVEEKFLTSQCTASPQAIVETVPYGVKIDPELS